MQDRSNLWKELAETGSCKTETVAVIGGENYAPTTAPVVNRALCQTALSVGNCVSASLSLSIDPRQNVIPPSATIELNMRLADDTQQTEWRPAGTFYISKRKKNPLTGVFTLQCFDAMLKANAAYPVEDESEWPKSVTDCIIEIAGYLSVEIDTRTWEYVETGDAYTVPLPSALSLKKVLGYIGAILGGNWCITPANKLRFIPLTTSDFYDDPILYPEATQYPGDEQYPTSAHNASGDNRFEVLGVVGGISLGDSLTVSGISIGNGTDTYTAGNETGYVIRIIGNPCASQAVADDLLEKLGGLVYHPFTLSKAVYDPCAELGDYVVSKNNVRSVLYMETATFSLAFRGNISSPEAGETEDEYPYIGADAEIDALTGEVNHLTGVVANKASIDDLYAVTAMIENLSVSDIKTGIIHSNDYEYGPLPLVYPGVTQYPDDELFPSNGEIVLKGFAIDFATGTIRGAFYSEQIIALQNEINALKAALVYPKSAPANNNS